MNTPPIPASALILAGGEGKRIGGNKLFLAHEGIPLLRLLLARVAGIFEEIVICASCGELPRVRSYLADLGERRTLTIAEDSNSGRGPLEGLRAGLAAMRHDWGFLMGCDMPGIDGAVVRALWQEARTGTDVVAMRLGSHPMSLHAFYRKSCSPHVERAVALGPRTSRGGAKIISFYCDVAVRVIEEEALAHIPDYLDSFADCNTRTELASAFARLGASSLRAG